MKTTHWIVIGVIVIALLALLVVGMQNDGVDQDMATTTLSSDPVVTNTANTADLAQVRAEAATDLAALQARVAAGESYEALAEDYAAIRARVTTAYRNAGQEASEEWQDIEAGFESFEASVRAGGSAALDSFASLIAAFSADVRTDSPEE